MKTRSCQYKQGGQLSCCTGILVCIPVTVLIAALFCVCGEPIMSALILKSMHLHHHVCSSAVPCSVSTVLYIHQLLYSTYNNYCTVHMPTTVQYVCQLLYSTYANYCTVRMPTTLQYICQLLYSTYANYSTVHTPTTVLYVHQLLYSTYANYCAVHTPTTVQYIHQLLCCTYTNYCAVIHQLLWP